MDATLNTFDSVVNDDYLDPKNHRTIESVHEYKLKTVTFANNTIDFIMTRIKHTIPKLTQEPTYGELTTYPRILSDEEKAAKDAENLERAVRRAKKSVHYAIRQIGADHLLTLTTRENITERAKYFEIFQRFIRLVRTKILVNGRLITVPRKSYAYVAVPELQDRGAYHLHCAVVGRQDIPFLRACWYVALGGRIGDSGDTALGQVDVQYRQKRWGNQSETHKTFALVRYLTKYIDKDFAHSTELGQHRYLKARDIPKPIEFNQVLMACNAGGKDFIDALIEVSQIAQFVTGQHPTQMIPWNRGEDIYILRSAYVD
jgi:hypothetical protein